MPPSLGITLDVRLAKHRNDFRCRRSQLKPSQQPFGKILFNRPTPEST
jgi:hypothetical protein